MSAQPTKIETKIVKADEFRDAVEDRAHRRDASGAIMHAVRHENVMLLTHWQDPRGAKWEVDQTSPPSDKKNKVLYLFDDEARNEMRVYCVPMPDHPGAMTRYTISRSSEDKDLRMAKTSNMALFVAWIAYELRELDDLTPAIRWQDEIREEEE